MVYNLKLVFRFFSTFGYLRGMFLFLQFMFGNVKKIKINGIPFPFTLRNDTSDTHTFFQVFLNNEYGISIPFVPKLIIDGGANIGLFALKMKQKFPSVKIICIEPDEENFALLQKNMEPYPDVFCEKKALWPEKKALKITDKFHTGKWGLITEEDPNGSVAAISLDELFTSYNFQTIDVLKIDIETSEKQLFATNYESWLPRVKIIIIELHDHLEPGCGKAFFKAVHACIPNYKYEINGETTIITNLNLL